MPWLRSRRRFTPPPVAPVPESESVRVAALRASWRRDRWVAQRRLWFRWTVWGLQRYAAHITAVVALIAATGWLVLAVQRWMADEPHPAPPMASAPASPSEAMPTPLEPTGPEVQTPAASGETEASTAVLTLRLDTSIRTTPPPAAPAAGAEPFPDSTPNPDLKPENWLHSKEP